MFTILRVVMLARNTDKDVPRDSFGKTLKRVKMNQVKLNLLQPLA